MSLKSKIVGTTLALTLTSALAFFFIDKKNPAPINRPGFLESSFTSKGLSNRILNVKITFDEAQKNSEVVTVTAHIKTPFDFKSPLNFKWKLGENVTLEEGLLTGAVDELLSSEEKTLSIKVKGFSREKNHHIAFEIKGFQNNHQINGDALAASDLESTFENTVQNVERIKASQ
ncbi:MAG: hypothetical protein ACXVAX_06525 [Pseudobdellovibrio sp.]